MIRDKYVSTAFKTTVQGIHNSLNSLPDCDPIRSVDDLDGDVWLQSWKLHSRNHPESFPTNESFTALPPSVKTVLLMIPNLL